MDYILYFFIYSMLGWVCECLYCGIGAKRFVNRGFLEGPYCPIYGWGALFVLYALRPFRDHIVLLFLAGMVGTSVLEYVTSYVMEKLFHSKWWDYSQRRFNLHGRICLRNSVMFGVMALVVVQIAHPLIEGMVAHLPDYVRLIVTVVLSALFLYDNVHTIHALARENKDYRMLEDSLRELAASFRTLPLMSSQASLSQRISMLLEESDADEKLLAALERLHAQYEKRLSAFRHTKKRLAAAFPKRLKESPQERAAALFAAFEAHRKENEQLRLRERGDEAEK